MHPKRSLPKSLTQIARINVERRFGSRPPQKSPPSYYPQRRARIVPLGEYHSFLSQLLDLRDKWMRQRSDPLLNNSYRRDLPELVSVGEGAAERSATLGWLRLHPAIHARTSSASTIKYPSAATTVANTMANSISSGSGFRMSEEQPIA